MQTLDIVLPLSGLLVGYVIGRLHRLHRRRRIIFIVETDDDSEVQTRQSPPG